MARARNIKPGVFRNDLLAECPPIERLLFIGLWTLADREGRLEDRPKRIRLDLFPLDDYDVESGLTNLAILGFIDRYTIAGKSVIQVNNFLKHQSPHGTEKDSELPARDGTMTVCERNANGHVTGTKRSVNVKSSQNNVNLPDSTGVKLGLAPPDSLIPDSLIPDSGYIAPSDEGALPDEPKESGAKAKSKSKPATLPEWLAELKETGEKPIPEGDTIFAWAEEVGIPDGFLRLAWSVFKQRMADKRKRQKDWRATFRVYVRSDYLKLWYLNDSGQYCLTTSGKQEQLAHG